MKSLRSDILIYMPVFIFTTFFLSCNQNEYRNESGENNAGPVVSIKLSQAATGFDLSELLRLEGFTTLGTNDRAFIYQIDKLLFHKGEIFVLNDASGELESVMVFDENSGKFKRYIGKQGEGPGEFWGLRDIFIHPEKDLLTGLVAGKMAMFTYGLNGNYIENFRTGLFGDEFTVKDGQYVIYNEYNSTDATGFNYLIYMKPGGRVVKTVFPFSEAEERTAFGYTGFLSRAKDEVLFSPPFSDTIYRVESRGYYPAYHFDFGEDRIPDRLRKTPEFIEGNNTLENSHLLDGAFHLGNYLVFKYKDKQTLSTGFYDERDGHLYTTIDSRDNYLNQIFGMDSMTVKDGDTLVTILTPEHFFYLRDEKEGFMDELASREPALFAALSKMSGISNPVLLYFSIRS